MVHLLMTPCIDRDHLIQVNSLKFVFVGLILLFILPPTGLICSKDHSANNVGFGISKKQDDYRRVNVISTNEPPTPLRNVVKTNGTKSNFQSNTSKITNNDKLVILTFGDTIKNQIKLLQQSQY